MLDLCVSAIASNQGKTILTSALLYHYRGRVRGFKIGPDFIDPQFHRFVSGEWSVNLDLYMQEPSQVEWTYQRYRKEVNILEGVMGYYDGMERGASAYDVTKLLAVPTLLVLDGSGSYTTLSAVLKGIREYRPEATVKGVVLNRLSSQRHYELIRRRIESDFDDVEVLGWIAKDLPSLKETHLGLDLEDLGKIEDLSREVLKHLDLGRLERLFRSRKRKEPDYPFDEVKRRNESLAIVFDRNFSFLYYDNLRFLEEVFDSVILIDSTRDEAIPEEADCVYLCGGYVESEEAYRRIRQSHRFRNSLIRHTQKGKEVFAECAGLLYLGRRVDEKPMSGILPIDFSLQRRFVRLGYYRSESGVRGHCFHYTRPESLEGWCDILSKDGAGEFGTYRQGRVFGTYLHTLFRGRDLFGWECEPPRHGFG